LKSIYLANSGKTNIGGHKDIFETPTFDFTNTTAVSISYYYSYAKRVATQIDTFRIQYSLDCGGSWSNVNGVTTTAQMAAAVGVTTTTSFTPTAAQWKLKTISSALLTALNNKPNVKFRFYFRVDGALTTANNMYLDQINIVGSIATGITEFEKSMQLSIYPNPTSSSSTLDFDINSNEKANVSIIDIMGRVLETNSITPDSNGHVNHVINSNGNLASGIYIVNIEVNNKRVSKK